jgi:hypothetical protein
MKISMNHRQFETLFRLKKASEAVQTHSSDVKVLVAQGFVEWATLPRGTWHLRLTAKGHLALHGVSA